MVIPRLTSKVTPARSQPVGDGDSIQPWVPATAVVSADDVGGCSVGNGTNLAVLCAWMQGRLVSAHTDGEQ
jgi:hypothetical protein